MSTDIKPGQVWKDRTGPGHVRIGTVTPTKVNYTWADGAVVAGTVGSRYVDEFLTDFEPIPAPLDPSSVQAGDTVTLESGTALVRDMVIEVKKRGEGQFLFYTGETPDPLIPGTYYLVNTGAWTLTDHQPAPKPEWREGVAGTAVVGPKRRIVSAYSVGKGAVVEAVGGGYAVWNADDVHAFTPIGRPLPTRDEMAEAIKGDVAAAADEFGDVFKISPDAAAGRVEALLRGES